MPRFLDHHPIPTGIQPVQVVQGQMMQKTKDDVKAGRVDAYGVKGINVFIARDQIYCLVEAPDMDAICKSHEARGIHLAPGDVTQVLSLV